MHQAVHMPFKVKYGRALSHLIKARKILEEDPRAVSLIQPAIKCVEEMCLSVEEVKRIGQEEDPDQAKQKDRIRTKFEAIEAATVIRDVLEKHNKTQIGYNGALLLHYFGYSEIAPKGTSKSDPAVNRFWKYVNSIEKRDVGQSYL